MKIQLKVEPKKSVLNGKVMMERINVNNLNKLLNERQDLLKSYDKVLKNDIYNNEFVVKTYQTEKEQLNKFKDIIKYGVAFVKYEKTRCLNNLGRVFPSRSLGLFSFRKEIRGALCHGFYVDIDIENCHPTLLLQIAKSNDIKCKYLEKYVNNREYYLNLVMENYNVDRTKAKDLFIMLLYFGSFKSWCEENKIEGDILEPIEKLKRELKNIGSVLVENNDDVVKLLKDKSAITKKKIKNITSSAVSFILQEWECQILEQLYLYCTDNKIINNNSVLCADGIMIPSEKYNDELLIKFNTVIKDKFGFDLKFVKKDLNDDIVKLL